MEHESSLLQCIDLTADAVAEARRLLANEAEPKGKALRVYVESGGCSGMQYGLVFDEQREGDHELDFDGCPWWWIRSAQNISKAQSSISRMISMMAVSR